MEVRHNRCAGLDVHGKMVSACRLLTFETGSEEREVRSFGTTPRELLALREWLREGGCTHVAMVSNGAYWKPVYNLLEGEAELLLADLRPWKHVPARRAGVKTAEWVAELLRLGLLKGNFVPPRPQRELRDLRRGRSDLIDERERIVTRIERVLDEANIRADDVEDENVTSAPGGPSLSPLAAGRSDAAVLEDPAQGPLREERDALDPALDGGMNAHHRFLLARHMEHLAFVDAQISEFDEEIRVKTERIGNSVAQRTSSG